MKNKSNLSGRSDSDAKEKYVEYLRSTGLYKSVRITKSPADITAITLNGVVHYYEIKFTSVIRKNLKYYLGAATTTEWQAAFENPHTFWFIIALEIRTGQLEFDKYPPAEFAKISYPRWNPQIFFNYDVVNRSITKNRNEITPEFISKVIGFFDSLRETNADFSI